jgi:uncharacterized CHY-type Zn-finger protein
MIACTRCGHWHTEAERVEEKTLSCTEVKQFWSRIKNEHKELHGHMAQITTDESGATICFKCKKRLL